MPSHTIVYLEDDPDLARLITLSLRPWPTTIYIAQDGINGLKLIREYVPNLILLDLNLPGLNGWEVCSKLASDPELSQIPIVVLTALDLKAPLCCDQIIGYILKPFTYISLREMLRPLLPQN
ncbi:MAG TPA: response regulator [Aggregatilineaceae bacterium]|nr:response regulator [Aggregatilineaceae bacterium]